MGEKGQIHTLEGFAAAFVIVFALIFGLQAVVSTSPGGLNQEVTTYDEKITNDVLVQSRASGEPSELKTAILNWTREDGFNGSVDGDIYYAGDEAPVPGEFGETLRILDNRSITYSIDIVCDGDRHPFVKNGDGGENPVTSTVTVTLNDDDRLTNETNGTRLSDAPSYPCKNVDDDSNLYNVVEVRMVAWRT